MNLSLNSLYVLFFTIVVMAHPLTAGTIISLGALGGSFKKSYGTDINESGQVVGFSEWTEQSGYSSRVRPFIYTPSTGMVGLATLDGSLESEATALNNLGQAVGISLQNDGTTPLHGVLYSGNSVTDLGSLAGYATLATDVNDLGQIVGWSDVKGNNAAYRAFLYSRSQMTDLNSLFTSSDWRFDRAEAINNSSQITGRGQHNGNERAFILNSSGEVTEIGTLGGSFSAGYAINEAGQVAGSSFTANAGEHAFLYTAGNLVDLGTLGGNYSKALGLNDLGQVVGFSLTGVSGSTQRAFLYSDGNMINLNDLIVGSGWELISAEAINNKGQITGRGLYLGQYQAFILNTNPTVPEPTSFIVWATGLVVMYFRRPGRRLARGQTCDYQTL